jgi:Pectinesterase
VVAADGTGDFTTVQRAIDHAPVYRDKRLVIEIRPGIYHERVTVPQDKPRVTFLGSDAAHTIITFDAGASSVGGTFFSSTVDIEGAEFEAAHITFENSHGRRDPSGPCFLHGQFGMSMQVFVDGLQVGKQVVKIREYDCGTFQRCLVHLSKSFASWSLQPSIHSPVLDARLRRGSRPGLNWDGSRMRHLQHT